MAEVGQALEEGNALRATATHNLNEASSRSHALFTLHMELRKRPDAAQGHKYLRCKLHLVDLAGAAAHQSAVASASADAIPVRCQNIRRHARASGRLPPGTTGSSRKVMSSCCCCWAAGCAYPAAAHTVPDMANFHAACPVAELRMATR